MIERVGSLSIVRFSPGDLGVFAPSLGGDRSRPTTAAQAIEATGALAVLDGPMFSRCDSGLTGTDAERYAQSQCARVDYLLHDEQGASVESSYPSNGATFSVVDGRVVVQPGAGMAPGAAVAVQTYPQIVRRGENIASSSRDTDRTWRAALALFDDGNLGFAIQQSSMHAFGAALEAAGAVEAGYTDGGGSGLLATSDGQRVGSSENRRVGSWLIIRPRRSSSGLALFGAGALIAAAILAFRTKG